MMHALRTAGTIAGLLATSALGQDVQRTTGPRRVLPVTAPSIEIEGTLDLRTGRFRRTRGVVSGLGASGPSACGDKFTVYDNTCGSGSYLGLRPAGPGGTGSAHAETLGDYGAIPATTFPGDGYCTVGCADDYAITEFEIAWCQLAAPPTGSRIELDFWDTPQASCQVGSAPGNNPTGGTRPPTSAPVFSTTLSGLPRNANVGTLACYVLSVTLGTPGFDLNGSSSFAPGVTAGDKFAWGFTMPTSTGADGPIVAGDLSIGTPCLPCAGTIWEVGGQTTNVGTGAGQDGTFFVETYGGSVVPPSTDCFTLGGSDAPSGMHLQLQAHVPCAFACSYITFCDAGDGALASCPCAPGDNDTGCDTPIPGMQGGGLTGGVRMLPVQQLVAPVNRATMVSTGFPAGLSPSGVVMRNNGIDPLAPVVFGDGIRCVDVSSSPGTFTRIGASVAFGGTMLNTFGHASMAGSGTSYYQLWFRSAPQSYCDPAAGWNLSNGVTLDW